MLLVSYPVIACMFDSKMAIISTGAAWVVVPFQFKMTYPKSFEAVMSCNKD